VSGQEDRKKKGLGSLKKGAADDELRMSSQPKINFPTPRKNTSSTLSFLRILLHLKLKVFAPLRGMLTLSSDFCATSFHA